MEITEKIDLFIEQNDVKGGRCVCMKCGYETSGSNCEGKTCPSCGAPMKPGVGGTQEKELTGGNNPCPGSGIRSKGMGRKLGTGQGRGPIGPAGPRGGGGGRGLGLGRFYSEEEILSEMSLHSLVKKIVPNLKGLKGKALRDKVYEIAQMAGKDYSDLLHALKKQGMEIA